MTPTRADVVLVAFRNGNELRAAIEPLARDSGLRVVVVGNGRDNTQYVLAMMESAPAFLSAPRASLCELSERRPACGSPSSPCNGHRNPRQLLWRVLLSSQSSVASVAADSRDVWSASHVRGEVVDTRRRRLGPATGAV